VATRTHKWEGPLSYLPQMLTPMHYVPKERDDRSLKWRLVFDCKKSKHNALGMIGHGREGGCASMRSQWKK